MVFKPAVRPRPLLLTNFLCRHYESRAAFVTVSLVSVHPFSGTSAKLSACFFRRRPFRVQKSERITIDAARLFSQLFSSLILFLNYHASLLRRLYLSSLSGIEGKRSRGSGGYADGPRNGERVHAHYSNVSMCNSYWRTWSFGPGPGEWQVGRLGLCI
jgi:hypothetical protein